MMLDPLVWIRRLPDPASAGSSASTELASSELAVCITASAARAACASTPPSTSDPITGSMPAALSLAAPSGVRVRPRTRWPPAISFAATEPPM